MPSLQHTRTCLTAVSTLVVVGAMVMIQRAFLTLLVLVPVVVTMAFNVETYSGTQKLMTEVLIT